MKLERRWAIFISGRGSNLSAAIDECGEQIQLVVTSSRKATGILRAKRAGIEIVELPKPIQWVELTKLLKVRQINRIFLLGFMKIIPIEFIQDWKDKMINLHPSLLPLYPGLDSIRRAYDDKKDVGVTVHQVIPEVDAGQILMQQKSVSAVEVLKLEFEQVELKVHQDEQRCVRKIFAGF